MLRRILILVLTTILAMMGQSHASIGGTSNTGADDAGHWKYQRGITIKPDTGFNRLEIPFEMYAKSQTGLGDIRIIDDTGSHVPYLIENSNKTEVKETDVHPYEATGSYKKKGDSIFDFAGTPPAGTDWIVNQLKMDLQSQGDFFKYIELHGSNDGKQWEWISNNSIYRVDGKVQDRLGLPTTQRFTSYRVKILDNHGDVTITGFSGLFIQEERVDDNKKVTFDSKYLKRTEKDGNSIITITGLQHLPLHSITVNAEGMYNRQCTLSAKDKNGNETSFEQGYLYQSTLNTFKPANNSLSLESFEPDFLVELTIENGDDSPLEINGVTLEYSPAVLIFEGGKGRSYTLVYGNENALQPSYDIEGFRDEIVLQQTSEAVAGDEQEIIQAESPQASEPLDLKPIFNGVILLVAMGLAWFSSKGMKKAVE